MFPMTTAQSWGLMVTLLLLIAGVLWLRHEFRVLRAQNAERTQQRQPHESLAPVYELHPEAAPPRHLSLVPKPHQPALYDWAKQGD